MPDRPLDDSLTLLERAQAGDRPALDELMGRYLPRIRRWAKGRLPRWARDLADTDDLIQETLVGTLRSLEDFKPQHDGALLAYLRQAVWNRILNEVRRVHRRPPHEGLVEDYESFDRSTLEQLISTQAVERYERCLEALTEADRALVVGRLEFGLSYRELAATQDRASTEAARKAVSRAIGKLVEAMKHV